MKEFDVLIIGGGPAGTATGLTILKKPGVSVGIIEQSNYSDPRIGEVLSPGMRNMLEYFDVWETFQQQNTLDAFSSSSFWGTEEVSVTDYLFTVHGSGWHLDRVAFDKMLAMKFAELGGDLLTETKFVKAEEQDGSWLIHTRTKEAETTIKTKYVVDATGRKGLFVSQQNINRIMDDHLIGVGCFGDIPSEIQIEQSILIEACDYGWWYSAPTPNKKMSVVLMTDLDLVNKLNAAKQKGWRDLLNQTKATSKRIKDIHFEGNPRSFLAHSSILSIAGEKNWLAVGDALSSHDPLSSSGIPHALGSGAYAGRVVVSSLSGNHSVLENYQDEINAQYLGYLKTKSDFYSYEKRFEQSTFWRRRNDMITIAADQQLESDLQIPESPVHLSMNDYKELQDLHEEAMEAHLLVSQFKEKHPEISDQSIILGLQEML